MPPTSTKPEGPARPRQVTWCGWIITLGSVIVLVSAAQVVVGIGSLDTRRGAEEFLSGPPGDGLGLDIDQLLAALRVTGMVAAACAVTAAILGWQVLQRSRSARAVLSVLALPLFVSGAVTGGIASAAVVAAIVSLWLAPARDWFAGREHAHVAARRPGAGAADGSGSATRGVWPPPYDPDQVARAGGSAATPTDEPHVQARPGAVAAACVVTWALCALVVGMGLAGTTALWLSPDLVETAVTQQEPQLAAQGIGVREVQVVATVMVAVLVAWCVAATALAVLSWRGRRWARTALLVSAAGAAGLALLMTLAAPAVAVVAVGCVATVVLLLRPEVRAWH